MERSFGAFQHSTGSEESDALAEIVAGADYGGAAGVVAA